MTEIIGIIIVASGKMGGNWDEKVNLFNHRDSFVIGVSTRVKRNRGGSGFKNKNFAKNGDNRRKTEEKPTILEEKKEITDRLTNEDFYRANHYFSRLNETGMSTYQEGVTTHEELLNLAYWLYVGEGGEVNHELLNETYYDVIPYDNFNEQISLYFDHELEKKGSATWGFQEDNYYQPALECGFLSSNFTQVDRVFEIEEDRFLVEGTIYRFDPAMVDYSYFEYLQPKSTWQPAMDSELIGNMVAVLKPAAQGERLVIESYETNYFAPEYSDVVSDVE